MGGWGLAGSCCALGVGGEGGGCFHPLAPHPCWGAEGTARPAFVGLQPLAGGRAALPNAPPAPVRPRFGPVRCRLRPVEPWDRGGGALPAPSPLEAAPEAALRSGRAEVRPSPSLPPPPTPTPTPQSPSPFASSPLPAARGGSELRRRSAVQNSAHVSAASPFLSPLP